MSMSIGVDPAAPTWAQDIIRERLEKLQANAAQFKKMIEDIEATPRPPGRVVSTDEVKISYSTPEEVAAMQADRELNQKYAAPGAWAAKAEADEAAHPSPVLSLAEQKIAMEAYWRNFAKEAGITPPDDILDGFDFKS